MESLLGRFAADRKLGRVADGPECCAPIPKDLGKLQRWVERNLLTSSKSKCRTLHTGRNNPIPLSGSEPFLPFAEVWIGRDSPFTQAITVL